MTLNPQLFHIYGPLFIHTYGLLIAIGISVALFLALKDIPLSKKYTESDILNIISSTVFAGFLGARLLWAAEIWNQLPSFWHIFYFWEPGYSILGAIIGGFLFLGSHLKKNLFFFLDRIAIYAPIAQAFGRIGCFFTGCCYGLQTTLPWAVIYTHKNHLAPLFIPFHPTQIYSAILLFCLFLLLYSQRNKPLKTGSLSFIYLLGSSLERFFVDFLRADRTLIASNLSFMQCIALMLIGVSFGFLMINKKK
jgi:phosphatidylglycerol---prolipoprotein diacylglyceryl transferase